MQSFSEEKKKIVCGFHQLRRVMTTVSDVMECPRTEENHSHRLVYM
jgi:hypothetical protein